MDDISVVKEHENNEGESESAIGAVSSRKEPESSSKTEGTGRVKRKCPYPSCSARVVHLPRHMRQKHKWDDKDAVGVHNMFA